MYKPINSTGYISYQLSGRQDSYLTLKDAMAEGKSVFRPSETIAITGQNSVRLFKNSLDEIIAVKAPVNSIKRALFRNNKKFFNECDDEEKSVANELRLLKQAYPEEKPCYLISGLCAVKPAEWTYRIVMPYIYGCTLDQCVTDMDTSSSFLMLILAVAIELDRIHEQDVIHGDVYFNNALAKRNETSGEYAVHFIDFGSAYSKDATTATITDCKKSAIRWAPERRSPDIDELKPDISQDVYSFGFMISKLFELLPESVDTEPLIFLLLLADIAQATDPDKRPDLSKFIIQIEDGLSPAGEKYQAPRMKR